MKVVLLKPEIPQNTGNIARLCACTGMQLMLVGPLGFSLENKYLKRAGLDYWDYVNVSYIKDLGSFLKLYPETVNNYFFISTKGRKLYNQIEISKDKDLLLIFGNETRGLPGCFYITYPDNLYRIPMVGAARSLNLSNSVAIVVYHFLEKSNFLSILN
jgi:tRNA (cytidine/uridine-2'-O-)-methyltransferase